jgi:3',5'-cyclic AMP phosphodiesterase CpdA
MFGSSRFGRIAHLSDVHTLEAQRDAYGWGHKLVSIHRRLDGTGRMKKLERALAAAKRSGADHVVISGDLTEMGTEAQFVRFAEALNASGIEPSRVTLVPGNHDAYTTGDAWKRALEGPLAAYAPTSARATGQIVDRGEVVFLPVDTSRYQSVALSGGQLTEDAANALGARVADPAFRGRAVVIVMHHPPFSHARRIWQYIDGLRGAARLMDLLVQHSHVQILHGHMHRALDRIVGLGRGSRVFGAPATVDDKDGRPRVRLYDVVGGTLRSAGLFAT